MTHIGVSRLNIIGSDNGPSPGRRQATIIWTNTVILFIRPSGTNFSQMLIEIQTFSFKKMHLKMSASKWRPFVLASIRLCSIGLLLRLDRQLGQFCRDAGLLLKYLNSGKYSIGWMCCILRTVNLLFRQGNWSHMPPIGKLPRLQAIWNI